MGDVRVDLEPAVRVRYELRGSFAPHVGVSYDREFGDTARLRRPPGEDVHATSLVADVGF
jgi:copper resistance protein B